MVDSLHYGKISKSQIKLVRSLQLKKFRDELGLFIAEGEKCVSELEKAFELETLIVEEGLSVLCQAKPVCTLSAKRSEIEQMSGLRTPQGVIGVFKKRVESKELPKGPVPKHLTLVLDGIQDPGNLGTIIRTCDWFGVHDILCSLDTADCYNPKVVQATMGALARVHIQYVNLPELLRDNETLWKMLPASEKRPPIYGTLLDGRNLYEKGAIPSKQSGIIIMGNEGNGISPEVRKYITHPLYIPSVPNKEASEVIESLNVSIATAIILAEFRRP